MNKIKLDALANIIGAEVFGNKNIEISGISNSPPFNNKLVFIENLKTTPKEINQYAAILTSPINKDSLKDYNLLLAPNPKLAFAKITSLFKTSLPYESFDKVKPNLIFGNRVKLGENLKFGKNVIIEDDVSIGNNVILGHNVVIGSNSSIGDDVKIESGTVIGSEGFGNVQNNEHSWDHIHHLGGVVINSGVSIGANCTIARGTLNNTVINKGVIIDNLVHIAHNTTIGENTAIAAKTGIAGSCNIGARNLIGGMVGIIDHITTADDVTISATSTVNKNIDLPGVYTGIMPISKHSSWKRIAFWITKIDKIAKFLNLKKI